MTQVPLDAVVLTAHGSAHQHPSAADVLLRRRWRAEHAFARMALSRLGWDDGVLMRWWSAESRTRPAHVTIHRQLRLSFLTEAVLSIPLALGILLIFGADIPPATSILVAALCGVVFGIGSGRRMGLFPFESLRRISPSDETVVAAFLSRVEVRYLVHRRAALWLTLPCAGLIGACRSGNIAAIALAILTLVVAALLHVGGIVAGGRIATHLARSRATRRVGFRRLCVGLAITLSLGVIGWLLARLVASNGLRALQSAFTAPAELLDASRWERVVTDFAARITDDLQWFTSVADTIGRNGAAIATTASIAAAIGVILLSRLRPVLIPIEGAPTTGESRDAVDLWLSSLSATRSPMDLTTTVLIRRLHSHRWALAQHFWTIMLPTPEAVFFLGGALGLLGAAHEPWTAAALLAMVGTMCAHNQATELRAELMPALGMSADRDLVPLLLSPRAGTGIALAVRARRRLLARHVTPSAVLMTALITGIAMAHGLSPWATLGVATAVAAAYVVAPVVQWYMGAVLAPEAYAERDVEQGTGSGTATLQSTLQGIPRIALVVLPSFALTALVVLQPIAPPGIGAALVGALLVLSVAALPALLLVEKRLAAVVSARGLERWSTR